MIFSTDVSSVHLQSWYNKLNKKPSLVKIHDCNPRGECRASANGIYTTEKSTGKWKIYFETIDGLNIASSKNIFGYHLKAVILCFTVWMYIAQNVRSVNWTVNIFKFTSAANLGSFQVMQPKVWSLERKLPNSTSLLCYLFCCASYCSSNF